MRPPVEPRSTKTVIEAHLHASDVDASVTDFNCGVPQGSVLSPRLFLKERASSQPDHSQ